jgi:PII interaction protein X
MPRTDARILVESRLRTLRRAGAHHDYDHLQEIYKQTFQ